MVTRAKGGGRKPKPSIIKKMQGTERKCRVNTAEPMPGRDNIKPPPELTPAARKYWPSLHKMLDDAGIIANTDVQALALLCETYSQWVEVNEQLANNLVVFNERGDMITNPYFTISNRLAKRVHLLLTEFGMTPAS